MLQRENGNLFLCKSRTRHWLENHENRDLLLKDVIVELEQDRDIVHSELDDLAEKLDFACDQYEDLPLKSTRETEQVCNKSTPSSRTRKEIFDWVIFRLNRALDEGSYLNSAVGAIIWLHHEYRI